MSQTLPEPSNLAPAGFSGGEAAIIDLHTAAVLAATDRQHNRDQPHGYFFGRKILEQILAQKDCVGLRIYFGMVPPTPPAPTRTAPAGFWRPGQRHLLVVGADGRKNDQLPAIGPHLAAPAPVAVAPPQPAVASPPPAQAAASPAGGPTTVGIIAEMAIPCPNQCGAPNPLNDDRAYEAFERN